MKATLLVVLTALTMTTSVLGSEDEGRIAVALEGGTLGVGGSVWYSLNKSFSVTAGYNWLGFDHDVDTSDVNYNGKLRFSNVPLTINWHPFKGMFRVVAGVVILDSHVDVTGEPNAGGTFTINGTTYTTAQVGTLSGRGEFENSIAPYIGIGWSKTSLSKGFGFFADIGVMYTGSPEASLSASGPINSVPSFQQDLAAEVQKVNDEIDVTQVYPVVRLGVMWRF